MLVQLMKIEADLIVFDPNKSWKVKPESFLVNQRTLHLMEWYWKEKILWHLLEEDLFINYIDIFLFFLISYAIGSIPFGLLLSFLFKKTDPRLKGSKNIGATNIARLSGWKIGLLTLILDISKVFSQYFFFK